MRTFDLRFCLLVVILVVSSCEKKDPQPEDRSKDLGLKVIPAGEKPARAPGPKGSMIEMSTTEVKVILVQPGGHAEESGFMANDVIVAADGKEVASEDDLNAVLKAANGKKIILEVRRGRKLYTLPLANPEPGWMILSGDTFKGFLLTRVQSTPKVADLGPGDKMPKLALPTFAGARFDRKSLQGRPAALMFWGTFSEPCYAHLQALGKACNKAKDSDLACVAIDTMELFTAVGKTANYQTEMTKVHDTIWTGRPIPIDLFMEAERKFGVTKLPTLMLVGRDGKIQSRYDGPMENEVEKIDAIISSFLSEQPPVPGK
jgi:membrane-associated protease RseP (regulator of RpoE activity)